MFRVACVRLDSGNRGIFYFCFFSDYWIARMVLPYIRFLLFVFFAVHSMTRLQDIVFYPLTAILGKNLSSLDNACIHKNYHIHMLRTPKPLHLCDHSRGKRMKVANLHRGTARSTPTL